MKQGWQAAHRKQPTASSPPQAAHRKQPTASMAAAVICKPTAYNSLRSDETVNRKTETVQLKN
jgi:hypothetical protein